MALESASRDRSDRLAAWLVVPLAALLTIVVIVFYVLFSTTTVDGESMLPTLRPADRLLATKGYSYPIRGDIVILHTYDRRGRPRDVVKRIIAVPGDTIEVRDDIAWVNGTPEPGDGVYAVPAFGIDLPLRRIPQGRVFVMGDNRLVSLDSRFIGTLPIDDIQGRVEAIFAPITRIRRID